MIYVDDKGHMIADSLNELHTFAKSIGLKREWFQDKRIPHYDLTTKRMISKAIINGANKVTQRQIVIIHSLYALADEI